MSRRVSWFGLGRPVMAEVKSTDLVLPRAHETSRAATAVTYR